MKSAWLVVGAMVAVGCSAGGGQTEPKPDPVTSSSGVGGSGTGGANAGGSGAGGDATIPGNQSGDRLKARWLDGADGSRQFFGWHDSQLGINCQALADTGGTVRCLPAPGQFYFTTDTCDSASALVLVYPTCDVPDYVSQAKNTGACDYGYSAREVLSQAANVTAVWQSVSGNCFSASVPSTGTLYSVGPPMPAATFVVFSESTDS